ncbi:MAG: hypothetical protein LBF77_02855 [Spirochaetaceae bacterium]|nr:hypothetical protein [Spirochaetaceae bacterium]
MAGVITLKTFYRLAFNRADPKVYMLRLIVPVFDQVYKPSYSLTSSFYNYSVIT